MSTFGTVALGQGLCSSQERVGLTEGSALPGLPALSARPTHGLSLLYQFISFHETFSKFRTLMSPLFQLKEALRATGVETDRQSPYHGQHNYRNYVKLPENLP